MMSFEFGDGDEAIVDDDRRVISRKAALLTSTFCAKSGSGPPLY